MWLIPVLSGVGMGCVPVLHVLVDRFALGVSPSGTMTDTLAIIVFPSQSGCSMRMYYISGYSLVDVKPVRIALGR